MVYKDLKPQDQPQKVMAQIYNLLNKKFSTLKPRFFPNELVISSQEKTDQEGLISVGASMDEEEKAILLRLGLVRIEATKQIPVELNTITSDIFSVIASLPGPHCRPLEPCQDNKGYSEYAIEVQIRPELISYQREIQLNSLLDKLEGFAKKLQSHLPSGSLDEAQLEQIYNDSDLQPIYPLNDIKGVHKDGLRWIQNIIHCLQAGMPVALSGPDKESRDYWLSFIAAVGLDNAITFGEFQEPISWRQLLDVASKAPGILVIDAGFLVTANSRSEVRDQVETTLRCLSDRGQVVLFVGKEEELRAAFTTQGTNPNPRFPIVEHTPSVERNKVVRHCLEAQARQAGVPKAAIDPLYSEVLNGLTENGDQTNSLIAHACLYAINSYKANQKPDTADLVRDLERRHETLCGVSCRPRTNRPDHVDKIFSKAFSPDLLAFLLDHLKGQDRAIREFFEHLSAEILSRPGYQPVRGLFQGTPGCGKSWTLELLSEFLGIPHVYFDCSTMTDHQALGWQVWGVSDGYVGCGNPSRIESAAAAHNGAVLEVADIDHCPYSVREILADSFLRVLETGNGQTGNGKIISCSKLMIFFTINLPGGRDIGIRNQFGFGQGLTYDQVKGKVRDEITNMISSAFLSRIGDPIPFDPLDHNAYTAIVRRALEQSITLASSRLGFVDTKVKVEESACGRIVDTLSFDIASRGARGLAEAARGLATKSLLRLHRKYPEGKQYRILVVQAANDDVIEIIPQ